MPGVPLGCLIAVLVCAWHLVPPDLPSVSPLHREVMSGGGEEEPSTIGPPSSGCV